MDGRLNFHFPSTKTAISMDNKKPSAKSEFSFISKRTSDYREAYD